MHEVRRPAPIPAHRWTTRINYRVPFQFTSKLAKLTLKLDRQKLTPEGEKRLMEAQRNNDTRE
jgi:hypothetical protein